LEIQFLRRGTVSPIHSELCALFRGHK
jgi:hypothetical protein